MDVLADGFDEHGYIINKARWRRNESGLSGFDFVFHVSIHKTHSPRTEPRN